MDSLLKKIGECGILFTMEKNGKLQNDLEVNSALEEAENDRLPEQSAEKTEKPARAGGMSLKKELLALLCLLLALILFCVGTLRILTPKRHDYGAVWDMYLQEPKNSLDVMFFGSSLVYCDIVPSVIYEETGVTSFVMAGPEQTVPITYWYLREALKTQSPKTVFIEVTPLYFEKANRSVKVNLTYMPWSMNRLVPTLEEQLVTEKKTPEETAQKEKEAQIGLLFPLYAYHDRWDKLIRVDLREGLLGFDPDPLAGYTFLEEVTPIEEFSLREVVDDPENYRRNVGYIKKILELCEEEGVRSVFFLSPYPQRLSEEQVAQIFRDMEELGGEMVDFNDAFEEPGFDFDKDFFDPRHLNYRGAEKFSRYLAARLSEWGASPAGGEDKGLWEDRVEAFTSRRDAADSGPVKYNRGEGQS